jgi:hypothetical protein
MAPLACYGTRRNAYIYVVTSLIQHIRTVVRFRSMVTVEQSAAAVSVVAVVVLVVVTAAVDGCVFRVRSLVRLLAWNLLLRS